MEKSIHEVVADVVEQSAIAQTITLWFDGACEPRNPGGIATCGWIIKSELGQTIASGCCEVCRGPSATNNVAEWSALGFALRWILDHRDEIGPAVIEIRGDSQLVINQLTHSWACNKPHLQKLRARCEEIIAAIKPTGWRATWIPREQNEEADSLSRAAYERATGKKFPERIRR